MPDILIRDLDEETVERLKLHARNRGRSLQAEVAEILADAARRRTPEEVEKLFQENRAALAGKKFPHILDMIREDRDR